MVVTQINIDLSGKYRNVYVVAKQGDADSRLIQVTLLSDSRIYVIDDQTTARVSITKPDKTEVIQDCVVNNNMVEVVLDANMLAVAGTVVAEILLTGAGGTVTSASFDIVITATNTGKKAESSNDYASFKEALAGVQNIDNKIAQKAEKAALLRETAERQAEIATERARAKEELAVERERINQFTALEEGSTTGDAELMDGRTDYTGKTWDNIGDHIRGVTGQLSSDIAETRENLIEEKEIEIYRDAKTVTGFISYDGIQAPTSGVYAKDLCVKAGEIYVVKGTVSATMATWGLYDTENALIDWDKVKHTENGSFEQTIAISQDGLLRAFGYYSQDIAIKIKKTIKNNDLSGMKWVAFGDSLTDDTTLSGGKNYVDFISINNGCNAINLGYGGAGFLHNDNNKYYKRVSQIPEDTDIITVFGSFNDNGYIAENLGSVDDDGTVTDPTTLGGAMNKFLIDLYTRCPNIRVGFISPISWKWYNPYLKNENTTKAENYVQLMKEIAQKWSIPFLDLFHSANIRIWDNSVCNEFTINNDGTHLTEEGHEKYIYKKVENFLKTI